MKMIALINGVIHPVERRPFTGGILIDGGRISRIGKSLKVPSGAECLDLNGKHVTPGLIDSHTHLGISEEGVGNVGRDYNEVGDPVTPQLFALDGVNQNDIGFKDAIEGGVTCVAIEPGSANVVGGQSVIIKTHQGRDPAHSVLRNPAGLKIAFGENPKGTYGPKGKIPQTRMGIASLLRELFVETKNYLAKSKKEREKSRSLKFECISRVLSGEIPARIHAHRMDDLLTALRIVDEFGLRAVFIHATESYKIPHEFRQRDIPVIVGPTITSRSKVELRDQTPETPCILYDKNVRFSITTDHPVIPIKYLIIEAILAIKAGLPDEAALRAITLSPAEILGIETRVGSIRQGKDADLVVYSGDPFDLRSRVELVFINGEIVYRGEKKLETENTFH
jgi:imidazolonepropionase-like amidohydrolase